MDVTNTVVVGSGVPLVVLRLDLLVIRPGPLMSCSVKDTYVLLLSSLLFKASDALLMGAGSVVLLLLLLKGSTAVLMVVGSGALLLDAGSAVLL